MLSSMRSGWNSEECVSRYLVPKEDLKDLCASSSARETEAGATGSGCLDYDGFEGMSKEKA